MPSNPACRTKLHKCASRESVWAHGHVGIDAPKEEACEGKKKKRVELQFIHYYTILLARSLAPSHSLGSISAYLYLAQLQFLPWTFFF
jgi:hypothetical protein